MRSLVCCLLLSAAWIQADPDVTLKTLLGEMTCMETLSRFPAPHYKTLQFASFDRRSKGPYQPGWYDNADGFGREPIPGFVATLKEPGKDGIGTYVMADVKGPGAIVRTWTAAIGGKIQVILDDAKTCLYDGDAKPFLDNPYKAVGGDEAILGGANGFNQREAGYFPIPFAKSCKILWTGNKSRVHFYQIQIRCYGKDAKVKTLCAQDLKDGQKAIQRASALLAVPDTMVEPKVKTDTKFSVAVKADERKTVFAIPQEDGAAISRFAVKVRADNVPEALRKTVLRMFFDGSPTAQVESPLGDFFGAAPGICPYTSTPFTVMPDGWMICRFAMPFAQSVLIEAENWSGASVDLDLHIKVSDHDWVPDESMHFCAHWRVDHGLLAKHANRVVDLPYLCARGKGVFVGAAAILMNPTPISTPYGGWWGEGDEKIWVDDDRFPSTFGTGSEDYFNYAWSSPDLFTHAYFAQPMTTGPGNRGHVVNNRWHIIDPLPFKTGIFFFMELFPHRPTPGLSYARLTYYYAFGHVRDDHVPLRPDILFVPELPAWQPVADGAARNAIFYQGEDLVVSGKAGGKVSYANCAMCAGGKYLSWQADPAPAEGGQADNWVELAFDVKEAGKYRVVLALVQSAAADHATASLNGQSIYSEDRAVLASTPHLKIIRETFGNRVFELKPGMCKLKLKAVDKAGQPAPKEVGLDYLWLMKQ